MQGIIFSLLAGIFITLQGIFNTNVSSKVGLWYTTAIVHGIGLIGSMLVLLFLKDGSLKQITEVNKLYLIGGLFGVLIVYSTMKGISTVGPAVSISIVLISQLAIALVINTFGLLGVEAVPLSFSKIAGLLLMVAGVVIFQMK
ncbi:DMT family transporter [Bacillus salacetis]|uniref:DMT family transporter n=1 Tax=Bacillus salacetis TaxID=2315464 RepID=A0A3A1QU45_9BACI|nr:DMT family transporter [Bacillus salacetis]